MSQKSPDRKPAPVMTGGCQCGAVRYAMHGALDNPHLCHCRMCQKALGSFFAAYAANQDEDFEVTRGEIAIYMSSDAVERGFCAKCGTPLTFAYVGSGRTNASIGSMDEPARAMPEMQTGIEARMPWFTELAGIRENTTENTAKSTGHSAEIAAIARTNRQHPDHDTAEWPPEGDQS